ncbi:hypothetical protein E5198_09400 [Pseudomonas sp. A-1]|uniref:hypothetical protein n=1 Tax=Pseudomonas sp. A-1 TaxID=1821274 RepID=UPI0010A5E326|nr:hypothetical protein [Pseudomonas sp. A-1]THG82311.1 hypothetical protein E5198_09400 [Pseudomonas sp. A-1]
MTWYLNFIDPGNAGGSVTIPESPPRVLAPIVYECPRCAARFDSPGERSDHFFVAHPYRKPALLLRGVELSSTGTVITEPTRAADWLLTSCGGVSLNGMAIQPAKLFSQLAELRQGFHVLELSNRDARERFELSFSIPEVEELRRLEDVFSMLFTDNELSVDDIRRFAEACAPLATARTYLEGVCQYLYGVLAKDQRGDTQLSHAQYKERFNRALEALRHVNRPMAGTIRAIINFSFNSFAQPAGLQHAPALASAAGRFAALTGKSPSLPLPANHEAQARLPIDHATDQLLRWIALSGERMAEELNDLRRACESGLWTAEDRTKATVLWLDRACSLRPEDEVRRMARSLLNDPIFAAYAEQVLENMTR